MAAQGEIRGSDGSLTARVEESWQRWQHALARMPADLLAAAAICGEWTAKDLMGHVAVWDAVAIEKIREIHEGVPWQRVDTDERNAREAEARADQPLDAQRAEMQMTHQRLLAALAAAEHLPADTIERIGEAIAEDTWEHYAVHTAELERWLAGRPA